MARHGVYCFFHAVREVAAKHWPEKTHSVYASPVLRDAALCNLGSCLLVHMAETEVSQYISETGVSEVSYIGRASAMAHVSPHGVNLSAVLSGLLSAATHCFHHLPQIKERRGVQVWGID